MKLVTIIASLFLLISFIGCKDKAQVKDAIVAKDITATPAVPRWKHLCRRFSSLLRYLFCPRLSKRESAPVAARSVAQAQSTADCVGCH